MNRRVTLSEVAREARVSLATASRAINGASGRTVRPDLAARVAEAAARLKYVPDATAQAMARGKTTTLGLLVHDIADPYFAAIASAVVRTAEAAGLQVTVSTTQNEPQREAELVDLMARQRVCALVLAGGRSSSGDSRLMREALATLRAQDAGVAAIGQRLDDVPVVVVDDEEASTELASGLLSRGYRSAAILTGPADRLTAARRHAGLRRGFGSSVTHERSSAYTWEGGYEAMTELIASGTLATVDLVAATNDVMALGALAAARSHGISVPGDVALAGFGGISTLRDVVPALTTVSIPTRTLGEQATRLALEGAEGAIETVQCTVTFGESTPHVAG